MKIVISGITGMRNRGVEAIVAPTLATLRDHGTELDPLLLTDSPDYDRTRLANYQVRAQRDSLRRFAGTPVREVLLKLTRAYEPFMQAYRQTANEVRSANVVVASGGDVFASEYGHRQLQAHLRPLAFAQQYGVPVVFLAQSIGPFKQDADAQAFVKVARRAAHVIVRESKSYDYVTTELGLSPDRVTLTADPAFLLDPVSEPQLARLREGYRLDNARPTIALGISQAIARYSGEDYRKHFEVWRAVIRMVVTDLGGNALLIPHVQELGTMNDDRILCTELHRDLDFDPRVRVMAGDHTAAEYKGVIASCELVASERMHACIAGLSTCTPTLAIGYSVKAEGILGDLGGAEMLADGALIPVGQFLDAPTACAAVARGWERRERWREQLAAGLPTITARAKMNTEIILDSAA